MKHIVALSGGKDSSAMALRLQEAEPQDYTFCYTPTGRELPEMEAHWRKLEMLLNSPLIKVPGPSLVERIIAYKTLPNYRIRFCTREVKIEPFMQYVTALAPATCYVGIRADEVQGDNARTGTDWNGVENVTQDFPLVRWGWGIAQVKAYLKERGVTIPARTDCDLCFFQRLPEWWLLWRNHPDRWTEAEALESFTGHTLRSAQRDSWPASLSELRKSFESGLVPKGANQLNFATDIAERPSMCAWCAR
jgi:hypothetical protein